MLACLQFVRCKKAANVQRLLLAYFLGRARTMGSIVFSLDFNVVFGLVSLDMSHLLCLYTQIDVDIVQMKLTDVDHTTFVHCPFNVVQTALEILIVPNFATDFSQWLPCDVMIVESLKLKFKIKYQNLIHFYRTI